jgi:hypothetical protein
MGSQIKQKRCSRVESVYLVRPIEYSVFPIFTLSVIDIFGNIFRYHLIIKSILVFNIADQKKISGLSLPPS